MKPLRTFRLEEFLGKWEFTVRYHLTASDAQSMTLEELLAMGSNADREGFMRLPLTYIDSSGRRTVARPSPAPTSTSALSTCSPSPARRRPSSW